ncbi:MAG: sulfite exporter TauE/SafE family protein [Patescibacteria group bacterium]
MKKTIIEISGMHCKSCELLLTDSLQKVKSVEYVIVNRKKGYAEVGHKDDFSLNDAHYSIKKAGYSIGSNKPKKWFSNNTDDYVDIAILAFVLLVIAFLIKDSNLFSFSDFASNNLSSLPAVFILGLAAGVSTCAALVGGMVLGVSAKFAQSNPNATSVKKFEGQIFFNIGRILGFTFFGGVLGILGSFFSISLGFTGFMTIVIGLIMLMFGLQLTGLFPKLSDYQITIPTGVAKFLKLDIQGENAYSRNNTLLLGAATFFLPCGFTQLVQIYAVGTANPITSALVLGTFALGTTPGLLGIGALTSFLKGSTSKYFYKFAGLVVIALAVFNISNGANLSGVRNIFPKIEASDKAVSGDDKTSTTANVVEATADNDTQVVRATYTARNDMVPNQITLKNNVKTRIEIDVKDDGFGCMGSMAFPGLSRQVEMLQKGKNLVFEFTPTKSGSYDITCAMGVPRGKITVL